MNSTLNASNAKGRRPLTQTERNQRRRLILQDSLALLSLTAITICMAVLTYFFFHSFREHRSVLEKRWFTRGQIALAGGRPQDAVEDFRSALSLSAANANYEMSLAEALAAAGRTEEAYAYFSTLHDAEPGDGFLNLQLARLEVRRRNASAAIDFYRSALNGAWSGQGTARRLQIRLELAKYLLSLGRTNEAQGELLTAEGNSLDNPSALFEIAELLKQADDPSDAWTTYERVARHPRADAPLVLQALLGEAQTATSMGQYKRAALALDRYTAKERLHRKAGSREENEEVAQQLARLQHMLPLIPFYGLQPKQRAERILLEAAIAHKRYVECSALLQPAQAGPQSPAQAVPTSAAATQLAALGTQWQQMGHLRPSDLGGNATLEQTLIDWTDKAEILTAKLCGEPTGDNALLLQLARVPDRTE